MFVFLLNVHLAVQMCYSMHFVFVLCWNVIESFHCSVMTRHWWCVAVW